MSTDVAVRQIKHYTDGVCGVRLNSQNKRRGLTSVIRCIGKSVSANLWSYSEGPLVVSGDFDKDATVEIKHFDSTSKNSV